jgi:hypothetical protein
MVRATPCFSLTLGTDPPEVADTIRAFLEAAPR